jgi:stearoyl-CoA desaturase (delta-9 desaturase)
LLAEKENAMATEFATSGANGVEPVPAVVEKNELPPIWFESWLGIIVLMTSMLGFAVAVALLWQGAFGVTEIFLFGITALVTGACHSVGYHRQFSHRSYQTYTPVRVLIAILGSMIGEGPVLWWAAVHRCHHHHGDQPEDLHSPHRYGPGFWAMVKGVWHCHVGFLLTLHRFNDWQRWVPDLLRDKALVRVHRLYYLWVFLGLAIPAAIGGCIHGTWEGALLGFLWGGLVRMFVVHQTTWTVNFLCHIWGRRPYKVPDQSRNNAVLAVLALGEGWHNNHHAFPSSAYVGLEWWEIDPVGFMIRSLRFLRLAWDVKHPSREVRREYQSRLNEINSANLDEKKLCGAAE